MGEAEPMGNSLALTPEEEARAATVLERLIANLRKQGVKTFRGDLKVSGETRWSLELSFERDAPSRRNPLDD